MIASSKLRKIWERSRNDYRLEIGRLPEWGARKSEEVEQDAGKWRRTADAVKTTWEYEKDRYRDSLERLGVNALVLGNITTMVLTASVVFVTLSNHDSAWSGSSVHPSRLMFSVAAAASTTFLIKIVGAMVRIASVDISSHMFPWATRSVALVVVADIGLFFVFENEVTTDARALVLGLFAGATGDHALQLLMEKAAVLFKVTAPPPAGPSPLFAIEGMTSDHVARLEEEGILSIHDLAFVPTARLFFNTAYSLQQICNWQDCALLQVYVGSAGAKALDQHMKMLGAIDLMSCVHDIRYDHAGKRREVLCKALALEEGGLEELIESMAHDEVTMRVRLYWQSTITNDRSGREWSVEATRLTLSTGAEEVGASQGAE